jgi:prophage regulatory protein
MSELEIKRDSLKLLRMRDLNLEYGLSPASVYRWIGEGEFPLPIRLGRNSVAWKRDEIEEWERNRPRAAIKQAANNAGAS